VRSAQLTRCCSALALAGAFLLAPGVSARAENPRSATVKTQKKSPPRRAPRVTRGARALRDAMTPRYKRDASGDLVPDVRAEAAIIFNPENGRVLWSENAHDQRSIASITKVMTALVFLEDDPDLTQTVTVAREDTWRASTTHLRTNEKLSLRDVLNVTLVASDNAGARVLARVSHGGTEAFVERMNEKAVELGLDDTHFADPSGLDPDDVSSAYDLSRLIAFAGHDTRIASIMQQEEYQFSTNRRRLVLVHNTNKLVGQLDVVSGKTGFISKAGYCLATLLKLPEGPDVAVVVLGAYSNLGRFWETRHLFNWLKARESLLGESPAGSIH
jgi:D-alanyl-D-alanine endopeptidase (penicillin-binding protein 7)